MNTPTWVNNYMNKEFSSGGTMGPDGKTWIGQSRNWMRKFVNEMGGTKFVFHPNHYCWSAFFNLNGQWWYVSSGDCRFKVCDWMLVRKCDGPRDFTGQCNQQVTYEAGFEERFKAILNGEPIMFWTF